MSNVLRYVSRIVRLPLVDDTGSAIGQVTDVVIAPATKLAPKVLGFVTSVQRRHIFVNANRITEVSPTGVRLRTGTIDVRPFERRSGELLAVADLLNTRAQDGFITDLSLRNAADRPTEWEIATVAIGGKGPLRRRRTPHIVDWSEVAELFAPAPEHAEVVELRQLRPADIATRIRALPLEKRRQLAEQLDDNRLADLLEELPEDEQIRIIEGLDIERAADILEEMDPDDAADLLHEMDEDSRAALLEAMDDDDEASLRMLLAYGDATAGGLMTPQPVALTPETTVAEALARLRDPNIATTLAAQVFVVRPPTSSPTGRFLGVIGFQRLLREPPSTMLGDCLHHDPEWLTPETDQVEVARRLAAYDLVALAVCDEASRLIGAVTIDDVVDHMLPKGWRRMLKRSPG
ncbi:MAG TPA: CBS domain-containing protein [Acidimicrobiales bacterium]|nr:CBS domain-containing protein [Acidimicrobiales bacterium]